MSLYESLILNSQDSEQVYDLFTFFFSYVTVGIIVEELNSPTIDFKALKQIFKYLHSEDMHFCIQLRQYLKKEKKNQQKQ